MKTDNVNINSDFWVGIVEDNSSDPLKLGQCKVRIIGTHSFDATELPTDGLPWAMPTIPLNTSKTVSVPNINDWVFGYFLDGQNKQMPVILGIMPGLINNTTYVKLTGQQLNQYNQNLFNQPKPAPYIVAKNASGVTTETANVSTTPIVPTGPGGEYTYDEATREAARLNTISLNNFNQQVADSGISAVAGETTPTSGEPTTPKIARGEVQGTTVDVTNQMRSHACDISFLTDKQISEAKLVVKNIVSTIRKGIKAALEALGISPGSSAIKNILDGIRRTLKSINKFLTDVVQAIADVVEIVRKIRGVIDYILSLPEKLIQFFKECLDRLYNIIVSTAFEIVTEGAAAGTAEVSIDIGSITTEINGILAESQEISQNLNTIYSGPSQVIDTLYNPSGMSDQEVETLFKEAYDSYSNYDQQNYQPAIV